VTARPRIVWRTTSAGTAEAWSAGRLPRSATGGTAYEFAAMRALAGHFDFAVDATPVRQPDQPGWRYYLRLRARAPDAELLVEDQRLVALGPSSRGARPAQLAIVHHIDYTLGEDDRRYRWYLRALRRRLPRVRAVVTVSRFWQRELEALGCRDVTVIHNAFDPAEYELPPGRAAAFRARFGLPTDRPLVYLGSAGPQKGGAEAWAALRDQGYTLIMTGRNPHHQPPVQTLLLERDDYLALLGAADVVVTFSTLLEGWNRVAHEAMLSGTPVVGSGSAGMHELLEGGGQIIEPRATGLAAAVRAALARRAELGAVGRAHAAGFPLSRFNEAWIRLVERVLA
jgi:glycosyltransferase involved in cell wall biosynthesis